MDIDWWSLFREARVEAWHSVAIIFKGIWNSLVEMLTSGELLQIALALVIIIGAIATSSAALLRLFIRLTRYGAF